MSNYAIQRDAEAFTYFQTHSYYEQFQPHIILKVGYMHSNIVDS